MIETVGRQHMSLGLRKMLWAGESAKGDLNQGRTRRAAIGGVESAIAVFPCARECKETLYVSLWVKKVLWEKYSAVGGLYHNRTMKLVRN